MNRLFVSRVVLVVLFISFLITGCRTLKIERPPESYRQVESTPPYSNINIPFDINLEKLERLVNRQFQGIVYSDSSYDNNGKDDLMLVARKTGNIELQMDGNQIAYRVPLSLWIKKRTNIGVMGYSYQDEREVTAEIALKFKTRITLGKDWVISSFTTSDGYEWLKEPVLRLGPVTFPLTFIADLLLSSNQNTINKGIDKAFRSSIDIKKMMTDVWKNIQVPVRITDDYPLWVKITPLEIRMIPIQASDGNLQLTFGLRSLSEVFYMEKQPSYKINEQLPEIRVTSKLEDEFSVNLLTDIPFTVINSLAKKELINYTISQGRYTVKLEDIYLYGNGDQLVVAAEVSGSIRGTIYFTGKPVFDKERSVIKINDLDFDVRTKNVLVRSAGWLFHNGFLQAVQSRLEFPVGDQLKDVRKQVQSALDENRQMGLFRVGGTVSTVSIDQITITQAAVKSLFSLSGKLKVVLDE